MDFSEVPFGERFAHALKPRTVAMGVAAVAVAAALFFGYGYLSESPGFAIQRSTDSPEAEDVRGGQDDATAENDIEDPAGHEVSDEAPLRPSEVYVHVGGCVKAPGLYCLAEGARIAEAIEAAGGFDTEADADALNLAQIIADGDQVLVPSIEETAAATQSGAAISTGTVGKPSGSATDSGNASSGLININTADASQLQSLSGIGQSTAAKIIADREKNGPFATIEDIKRVSGIGERKYEAIRDFICV